MMLQAPSPPRPRSIYYKRASRAGANTPLAVSDFLFREDLYSLGYVFLELVFCSFCETASKRPDQNALKRLLEDIFKGDFRAFKEYCLEEDAWQPAIGVLDAERGSGWGLAGALLGARSVRSSALRRREDQGYYGDDGGDDDGDGGDGGGEAPMVSTRAVLSLPYFKDSGSDT